MSSSAGFALLTDDETASKRFLDELGSWPNLFSEIIQAENPEVQRRCIMGIANIVEKSEANASRIMAVIIPYLFAHFLLVFQTEIFKILVAITKLKEDRNQREGAIKEAQRALDVAERFGVIKPTDRQLFDNKLATVSE